MILDLDKSLELEGCWKIRDNNSFVALTTTFLKYIVACVRMFSLIS